MSVYNGLKGHMCTTTNLTALKPNCSQNHFCPAASQCLFKITPLKTRMFTQVIAVSGFNLPLTENCRESDLSFDPWEEKCEKLILLKCVSAVSQFFLSCFILIFLFCNHLKQEVRTNCTCFYCFWRERWRSSTDCEPYLYSESSCLPYSVKLHNVFCFNILLSVYLWKNCGVT